MQLEPDGSLMKAFMEFLHIAIQYSGLVLVAILGSTANYISQIRNRHKMFSIVELIGEWFISGFSALMVALVCEEFGVSWTMTVVMCGIAGHMGGRTMFILESALSKYLKRRYPNVFKDIDLGDKPNE